MNTPVSESVFVQALKDLANVLDERENDELSRIIPIEAPALLREIAENFNESNLEEMSAKCIEVIDGFHNPQGVRDDVQNLQAVVYHLGTLWQNPLRSEGDTFDKLSKTIFENRRFLNEKLQHLESYSR